MKSIERGVMAKHVYNLILIACDRLSNCDGQTTELFKIHAMLLQMHFTVLLIVVWIYSQGII